MRASRRSRRGPPWGVLLVLGVLGSGLHACGGGDSGTSSGTADSGAGDAQKGRRVYMAVCIACHNPNPALDGPIGPAVKGSSRELLEARILRGAYPPGYAPKRRTALMPKQPQLEADIVHLWAFLR